MRYGVAATVVHNLGGHAVALKQLAHAAGGAGSVGNGDDTGGGVNGVSLVVALGLRAEDGQVSGQRRGRRDFADGELESRITARSFAQCRIVSNVRGGCAQ